MPESLSNAPKIKLLASHFSSLLCIALGLGKYHFLNTPTLSDSVSMLSGSSDEQIRQIRKFKK